MPAAAGRGITVCGTPLVGSSTVELTWALILAVTRDIPGEDRRTRAGQWQQNLPLDLAGGTLGVVGLGRLGRQVTAIAKAFGMNVLAWSRHLTADVAADHGAEYAGFDELFERSDVVTVHVTLNESSRGLVGARQRAAGRHDRRRRAGCLRCRTAARRPPAVPHPAHRAEPARRVRQQTRL